MLTGAPQLDWGTPVFVCHVWIGRARPQLSPGSLSNPGHSPQAHKGKLPGRASAMWKDLRHGKTGRGSLSPIICAALGNRPGLEKPAYDVPSASASAETCTTCHLLAKLMAVARLSFPAIASPS